MKAYVAPMLRIPALLGLLVFLLTFAACLDSGVGGYGQPCNKFGYCKDHVEGEAAEGIPLEERVFCCPNTSTCISYQECYGAYTPPVAGGENEPCYSDYTCNSGFVCCRTISPVLCRLAENCPDPADGDEPDGDTPDGDTDGDEDGDIDGDEDGDIDDDIPIEWPDLYIGAVCTPHRVCWDQPWPTADTLTRVWTSSDDTVWMVGTSGTRIQFDKKVFEGVFGDGTPDLKAVHGTSDLDTWAVGANATVMRFDGESWVSVTSGAFSFAVNNNVTFNDVYADGIGNLYVIGERGTLYKLLDGVWSQLSSSTTTVSLNRMWSIPEQLYVIVGNDAKVIVSYDQFDFSADPSVPVLTDADLYGVWGWDQAHIFVVGDKGTVLFYDETTGTWYPFDLPGEAVARDEAGTPQIRLNAVKGRGTDVFIVGEGGAFYRLVALARGEQNPQFAEDAAAPEFLKQHVWERIPTGTGEELLDLTITSMGEIFIVGRSGSIFATSLRDLPVEGEPEVGIWRDLTRRAGNAVDPDTGLLQFADVTALRGYHTTLFSGMNTGYVQYMDLRTGLWEELPSVNPDAAPKPINDIWVRENGFAYFFGDSIYKWIGSGPMRLEADPSVIKDMVARAAWGFPGGSIWTVGERVIFFNGVTWQEIDSEPLVGWNFGVLEGETPDYSDMTLVSPYDWRGVWGYTVDDVWVVGVAGVVANRVPNPYSLRSVPDFVWRSRLLGDGQLLTDVWGADSNKVWIIGAQAGLWFYNGTTFKRLHVSGAEPTETFLRIYGLDAHHILITSDAGKVYASRDGLNFGPLNVGYRGQLTEIWPKDLDLVFFAGQNGAILRGVEIFDEDIEIEIDGDVDGDEPDGDEDGDEDGDVDGDVDGDEDGDVDADEDEEAEDVE